MSTIEKISGVPCADVLAIGPVPKDDAVKVSSVEVCAAGGGGVAPTVAVVCGQKNWVMTSKTQGFASGTWTAHQANSRTADTQRNIAFGRQPGGLGTWVITMNKTARPIRVSTDADPEAPADWTEVNPTGEAGYDITHGDNDVSHAAFVLVGNDAEYASYFGDTGESITTAGDWSGRRPLNGDLATSKILTGIGYNHNADNPLYVAVSNTGRVFSSTDGGNGDAADWTTRYGTTGTSGANHSESRALWEVAYGNDKWVAVGYYDKYEHITGSGDATSWGVMNLPGNLPGGVTKRQMYGVDSDGNNNWVTCGSSGYVWYSTDNAASWTEIRVANAAGTNGTWQCVRYDGNSEWWLVGMAGHLAKSTDMINWTTIDTPVTDTGGATVYSIAFNTVRTS